MQRSLLAASVVFLALALAAGLLPRARQLVASRGSELLLLSGASLAALLGVEAALRLTGWNVVEQPPLHRRFPHLRKLYRVSPERMPGVNGESRYTTNSLGLRGPEPPPRTQAYRVLCLGGSTTECTYLDDEEAWPYLMMRELDIGSAGPRVWVGNAGISGYSTVKHLEFVRRSELMGQIDCAVFLVGVNDLALSLKGRNAGRRPVPPALWTKSRLLRWAERLESLESEDVEDPWATNYLGRRRERQRAILREERPILKGGLEAYGSRLRLIARACRRQGVRPVFVSQPVLWRAGLSPRAQALLWWGKLPDGRFLAVERLREAMDAFNEVLRDVSAERQVELVDLSSLSGDEALFFDDCHFNEAGARAASRLLAHWFRQHPA